MRVLVIEAATAACSVALLEGGLVIAACHEIVGRGHAERLVPMIGALLGDDRPDAILVDCGPGSFTGVRVGLAAARALGFGWGVPVRGYGTLALLAAAALAADPARHRVTAAVIGGHGELFVRRFSGPGLAAVGETLSLRPEAAARLAGDDFVVGSGVPPLLAARGDDHGRECLPVAADAVLLPPGFADLPPVPVYGRPPDAKLPG